MGKTKGVHNQGCVYQDKTVIVRLTNAAGDINLRANEMEGESVEHMSVYARNGCDISQINQILPDNLGIVGQGIAYCTFGELKKEVGSLVNYNDNIQNHHFLTGFTKKAIKNKFSRKKTWNELGIQR